MANISNSEIQIDKLDNEGKIIASYSGATVDRLEKGGTIYIEMLETMSESLRLEKELIDNKNNTFIIKFGDKLEDKKFVGVINRCIINPFNCERTSFEAEIKICSNPDKIRE